MKALVLTAYNSLTIQSEPIPQFGPEDVLVRVKACAICGSDVHGMDGSSGRRIPPVIMGHEASGIIEKTGDKVSEYQPGDRVTFDSTIYCGTCYFCRRGEINLCDNRRVIGVSCDDYRMNGAFAEYIAVPQRILYRVPGSVSFEQAAMVEPLSVAFHALRRSPVSLNQTALVVGSGMIGLLIIQLLKLAGCGQIVAVDRVQERLDMARKFGADQILNADSDDVFEAVQSLTHHRGADVSFEVVGMTATTQTAIQCVKKGGAVTLVGNVKPVVDFPLQAVVTRQLTLNGTCSSAGEYPDCLDLIAKGKVDVNAFISAVAPLEEGDQWFKRLYAGEPGLMKVILKP
jgi:L-iditol 2-dehydrogenase